jgi:hypothetical protein
VLDIFAEDFVEVSLTRIIARAIKQAVHKNLFMSLFPEVGELDRGKGAGFCLHQAFA